MTQAAAEDGGGEYHPQDAWQAGLAAKQRIEQEMGWWNGRDEHGNPKPPWR